MGRNEHDNGAGTTGRAGGRRRLGQLVVALDGRPEPARLDNVAPSDPLEFVRLVAKHAMRRRGMTAKPVTDPAKLAWMAGLAKIGRANATRCTAEKRDGTRCRNPVVRGSDRCHFHEGVERAPWSRAAKRRFLAGDLKMPKGRWRTHPTAEAQPLASDASPPGRPRPGKGAAPQV